MIEKVESWKVTCDGCGIAYPLHEDKVVAQNAARESGWSIVYGAQMRLTHVYCRSCWRKVKR